jgi:hypothetical protein
MRAFKVDLAFSGMGVCTHKRMILFFSISLCTIDPVVFFVCDKQCCFRYIYESAPRALCISGILYALSLQLQGMEPQ